MEIAASLVRATDLSNNTPEGVKPRSGASGIPCNGRRLMRRIRTLWLFETRSQNSSLFLF